MSQCYAEEANSTVMLPVLFLSQIVLTIHLKLSLVHFSESPARNCHLYGDRKHGGQGDIKYTSSCRLYRECTMFETNVI